MRLPTLSFLAAASLAAVSLAACAGPPAAGAPPRRPVSRPSAPAADPPGVPPRSANRDLPAGDDVRLGGVSLVGTWAAIAVEGDAGATQDLEQGLLEQTLVVRPRGYAVLTGVDHRADGEPVSFGGEVRGDRVTFGGLDGAARLSLRGRRLLLLDPRGRTTVFVRVG